MASLLYFNGVDSVSISKRLGHAQVSTTANIYAHVIEAADQKNAGILADVFLKKAWILKASWIKVELSRFWRNPTIWKSNEKSLDSNESRLNHGIPTVRGYNAPCFEGMVHNFVGSILMRWDNEDRKDILSIVLAIQNETKHFQVVSSNFQVQYWIDAC